MKKSICWLCGMWATIALWGQGHEARLAALDVLHYDFQIAISDSSDRIEGRAKLQIELKQAADRLRLDLVGLKDDGKGMKVSAVRDASQKALVFNHAGEALEVELGSQLAAGTQVSIEVYYVGIPADGLVITDNERDGRSFFGDNWPNRARHWLPTVDHPSDKASVDFTILAPAHFEIVANGVLQEQLVGPDGTQRSHWHNEEPLPTKVMVFGAADFAIENVGTINEIPVSSWVFEADEVPGFKDYKQGLDILAWYIDLVGDYPWAKLANVQSRTRYGGMENASCIFYSEHSVKGDGSCEALMAHEIAHQWFGNSASEANWHHIWLSEGFATYLTHVYFQQKYDQEAFAKRMAADRLALRNWAPIWKLAVVDPSIQDLNQLLSPNSYEKGSWVLHMLRQQVGERAFFAGLREYYAQFKFGNALSGDFQRVMEGESGLDLGSFFKQWLERPGYPKIDVVWSWKRAKGELTLTIAQTQVGDAFAFPLEVAAVDEHGETIATTTIAVDSKQEKAVIKVASLPVKVVLDPGVKLLFDGKTRKK